MKLSVNGREIEVPASAMEKRIVEFLREDLDWDGHMWVAIGEYLADISLLVTARSPGS